MRKGIYTIEENSRIACRYWRMRLSGEGHGFTRGGQFADIALEGKFLRRPIAARDWDEHGFDIIYKVVGDGTSMLSGMKAGQKLDVLTALGNGFDSSLCSRDALLVAGGVGASPLFHLAKELIGQGKHVTVAIGYNKADEMILEKEYRELGVDFIVSTMDGSAGVKGLVTEAVKAASPRFDHFYTCGPKVMMKAVCEALDTPGEASLEERMGCGCGICYGCTCHTANGPARICADGPVFRKEDLIW